MHSLVLNASIFVIEFLASRACKRKKKTRCFQDSTVRKNFLLEEQHTFTRNLFTRIHYLSLPQFRQQRIHPSEWVVVRVKSCEISLCPFPLLLPSKIEETSFITLQKNIRYHISSPIFLEIYVQGIFIFWVTAEMQREGMQRQNFKFGSYWRKRGRVN